MSTPFVSGLSGSVHFTLNKVGLNTVYTIPKKLDVIIKKDKDRLEKERKTGIVYRINCSDCNVSYVGQTKRHLQTRKKEHQNDIKKNNNNHSVISKHRISCRHNFKWSNVDILHKEKNIRKREIAEIFFIKRQTNSINLQKDTENLNQIYDSVISNL